MPKRKSKKEKSSEEEKNKAEKKTTITTSDVASRISEYAKTHKMTEREALEDIFSDGWLTVLVEESGKMHIDSSQLYKKESAKKDTAAECERLAKSFVPVASCIKYMIDQIVGGGIEAVIDDPKDSGKIKEKEEITQLINDIHQDRYTRGLFTLAAIMTRIALVTGVAAAEICFEKADLNFWDYASIPENLEKKERIKITPNKGNKTETAEYILINTNEPQWDKLAGIVRLKIAHDARKRFRLYRDPKTWEAKYWSVDEVTQSDKEAKTTQGIRISLKTFGQEERPKTTYYHPWQVFWLVLNRDSFSEKAESVIEEVLTSAQLLEKILGAVGEGIYRAGNKKYFIVCGTEARPWRGSYIRNFIKQLTQASTKNWSVMPAPAGFDIKDIGGEVFEADNVVAYFKKIIARGLGVPAKVLGIDVRDEPSYNYEIMREQLRMAVKFQLFEPHLWCKHGAKALTKQGGKASRSIYVPNPRFMYEKLLSFEKRIELLFKGHNVANPFHPLIKLRSETEYCKIMGWDDVPLPTQEELKEELEIAEEEAKKKTEEKKKDKEETGLIDEKRQGDPEPQTVERQKKRQAGMTDKHPDKGKSKKLGGPRVPKEVQESVPTQKIELNINIDSEPLKSKIEQMQLSEKKLAEKEKEIMTINADIANIEKSLIEKRGAYEEETNKQKQKSIQAEIEKIDLEKQKLLAEINKITEETNEIKMTHEKQREAIEQIKGKVDGK